MRRLGVPEGEARLRFGLARLEVGLADRVLLMLDGQPAFERALDRGSHLYESVVPMVPPTWNERDRVGAYGHGRRYRAPLHLLGPVQATRKAP
ncbi:hypothetical protein ACIBUY_31495 [Streptomyces sp. NPDC050085]|uniref:hypothetical protein n=1 Tax=Streptomyces sp. NPDC050085 TaxID=3365600 RepID=UPI00378894FA